MDCTLAIKVDFTHSPIVVFVGEVGEGNSEGLNAADTSTPCDPEIQDTGLAGTFNCLTAGLVITGVRN